MENQKINLRVLTQPALCLKLGLLVLALATLSCESNYISSKANKTLSSNDNEIDQLNTGINNQAPKISCVLSNMNQPSQQRTIDTIGEKDTFFSSYPIEGDRIQFNCSASQDEAPTQLLFFIDTDYDSVSPNWQKLTQSIVLEAGRKLMAIKAVDSDGLETIKTFAIDSQCAKGEKPIIDAKAVRVMATAKHNFYDYSAAHAVTGGSDFQYAWDFNGDSVFDPYPMSEGNGSAWIDSATANNVYSIFASTNLQNRKAFLRVRNGCNLESETAAIDLPNELPNIERTPTAQAVIKPYYYLQTDIKGIGTQSSLLNLVQRTNGPFLATKYPSDTYRRVICTYDFKTVAQKARFSIQGFNWYQGENKIDISNEFLHGMEIKISDIPDNGQQASQTYTQNNGVKLNHALYKASAAGDGINDENFNRIDTACTVEITIERAKSLSPCSQKTNEVAFEPTGVTILLGEFNCPKLTDSESGKSVAANNGKFYCEVAPQDQCIGGGGGGGGTPPREQ